jgi:hypothetical protein
MLEHKGRRFKKFFAKHPATSETPQAQLAPPPKVQTIQRRKSHGSIATSLVDSFQERTRRWSSIPQTFSQNIQDTGKASTASSRSSNLKRSDNRRSVGPTTQLRTLDISATEKKSYLPVGNDPSLLGGPSQVRFSEDVADRYLEVTGSGNHPEPAPAVPQSSRSSRNDPTSEQRLSGPNDAIIETPPDSAHDAEEDRRSSISPYASIGSYDRKFSQPKRGSQASNIYVRAGRKATGWVASIPPDDISDDDALDTQEARRISVIFAQPEQHSTHKDLPHTNAVPEYDPFRPSDSNPIRPVFMDQTPGGIAYSSIPKSANASKSAHFRAPAVYAGSSASQNTINHSIVNKPGDSKQPLNAGQPTIAHSEEVEAPHNKSSSQVASRPSISDKELSWQTLLRQNTNSSHDSNREKSMSSTTATEIVHGTSSDKSSDHSIGQTPMTPPGLAATKGKPLPPLPSNLSTEGVYTLGSSTDQKQEETARDYLIHDSSVPIDPSVVIDLSNTRDTDAYTSVAPAVTHETIHPEVHHIREEQITREIHNYDIYHRVLPIIETEILPARHFIHNSAGELVEIPASEVPGRTQPQQYWPVEEKLPSASPSYPESWKRRPFTARHWSGTDGQAKDYVDKDGVHRTETTWVHPPQLEDGGRLSGQTVPFHFDDMGGLIEKTPERMPGGWQFDGTSNSVLKNSTSLERKVSLDIRRKPVEGRKSYVKTLESNFT